MELTQAQQDLVEKNINLVYKIVTRMNMLGNEDAIQEGLMGLCVAAARYDCNRNKFSTFATHYIRGYIMHYLKDQDIVRPFRDHGEWKYANVKLIGDEEVFTDTKEYYERISEECDMERIVNHLDDSDKLLYQMIKEDMTQMEMARVLNCSQTTIVIKSNRLKKRLEVYK